MSYKVRGITQLEAQFKNIGRAIPGAPLAQCLEEGAWVIAYEAQDNVLRQDLVETLDLHDSIEPKKINQSRVDIEVGVVYGAVHEFGLDRHPITDRQRAFFWAMWASEKDEMWKALALSKTYTIPARPYLRPAVDTEKKAALKVAARSLDREIAKAAGR